MPTKAHSSDPRRLSSGRRHVAVLLSFVALLLSASASAAQDVEYGPQGEQLPAPKCAELPQSFAGTVSGCNSQSSDAYLADIRHWRDERKVRVGLDISGALSEYDREPLRWTQSSFMQPQAMVHDRYFYDPAQRRYTVDRYLKDVTERYGGIDSVLLWHTYPNIGIDDRNQFDLFGDLPDGMEGVKAMVADFHRAGVRVLFPVMVWDRGTHRAGQTDAEALTRELAEVGADGINGDTLDGMPRSFRVYSDRTAKPLALEPESVMEDGAVAYNNLSWGYWKYGFAPLVSRYKWLEPRHMVHVCNRWSHNHLDDLQFAFFNGVGFETWENVWSIWNELTPRDAESVRRVGSVERTFAKYLTSPQWEPHTPMQRFGVFASKWPLGKSAIWTIVNRNDYPVSGSQIEVSTMPGWRYYDIWNGTELTPEQHGEHAVLSFPIEAGGYGTVLATASELTSAERRLFDEMRDRAAKPLQTYSTDWHVLPQAMVPMERTRPTGEDVAGTEMKAIPAADYLFRVNGIEIEGFNLEGSDAQYPWEPSPRRYHEHVVHIDAFSIDKYPVTNEDYKRFLVNSHYVPADTHNFLRDWKNGSFPAGAAKKPVTWVSIEDARAYAAWAGKRLPHEWEWQYAAQGADGRTYPWGSSWTLTNGQAPVPKQDQGTTMEPASDVDAHPAGASPFGVMDMVGNVWQWTDEFVDEHTRTAVLRGGSHYRPQGSRWYFPQAYMLTEHGKYLLMAPSLDRSGAVGFRCVRDSAAAGPLP